MIFLQKFKNLIFKYFTKIAQILHLGTITNRNSMLLWSQNFIIQVAFQDKSFLFFMDFIFNNCQFFYNLFFIKEQSIQLKMDSFRFQNQGKNYGKFRPTYSESLYAETAKSLESKEKYLDIAMGTGQLLFNLAPQFKCSKGIDISDKMLQAARSQLSSQFLNLKDKVQIQKCGVLQISENQKFDLITIGQALHWLPIKETLRKLKNLLSPKGKVLIISYIVKGLEEQSQDKVYQKFYEQTKEVKPQFCFNRDELHQHYENQEEYLFKQYFEVVNRSCQDIKIKMPKSAYINYLKTYAGYNHYKAQNRYDVDPIIQVQQKTRGQEVTVIIDYFMVQCQN